MLKTSVHGQLSKLCCPGSVVSSPSSVFLCLPGRKAGRVGSRLLGDSVQAFRPLAHGARSKQLQALGSPQPVCHPQKPVHQRHAGKPNTPPAISLVFIRHAAIPPLNYTTSKFCLQNKGNNLKKCDHKMLFCPERLKLCVHNMRLQS